MEIENNVMPSSSYLIQRLRKPPASDTKLHALADVIAFGGGMMNGGLTKEAFALIKDIFRFDYMGSSEYEWGAVPEALRRIYENRGKFISFQFECPWNFKSYDKTDAPNSGKTTVYVLCRSDWKDEVEKRITTQAADRYGKKCKENPNVSECLSKQSEYKQDIGGWLELDNGFFFFSDKDMFTKTASLFGIGE